MTLSSRQGLAVPVAPGMQKTTTRPRKRRSCRALRRRLKLISGDYSVWTEQRTHGSDPSRGRAVSLREFRRGGRDRIRRSPLLGSCL